MSSGIILVLAVLFLGGIIATVGDRLGTKVGKARLSLFKLRPKRTATLVTILTGSIISASTLAILFAASDQLRTGVFELNSIQRKLRKTRSDLSEARSEKEQIEMALGVARTEQSKAKRQLSQTKKLLNQTQQSLATTDELRKQALAERTQARTEKDQIESELERTRSQLAGVSGQLQSLRSDITQLQQQRDQVIADRNRVISRQEQDIQAREAVIRQKETQVRQLEAQQEALATSVSRLEQIAQGLRQGNVALQRGQILASATIRIVDPDRAQQAVDQLLQEANRRAVQLIRPGTDDQQQIIEITQSQVQQLIQQIKDGQNYVVQVAAIANYLVGETPQVFVVAVPNQVVLKQGTVVAGTSLTPSTLSDAQLQDRINLLLASAGFRARRLGMLTDRVEVGRIQGVIAFIEQLKRYSRSLNLKAVASETTYTAGPLQLELIAEEDGQILFRSQP